MKKVLERIKGLNILVFGDVMLDRYVNGEVSRISPEAPVPVLRVEEEKSVAGGAANVALNLACLVQPSNQSVGLEKIKKVMNLLRSYLKKISR